MKVNEKTLRWLFLAIITVSFIVNYAAIFDKKLDVNGDNYMYYLLAHSLSTGQGYVSDIGPEPAPHTHFPPGYPVFLSLFLRIFPNNIVALKLLNGLLFLASLFLLFRIVRKTTGKYGLWYALAACLLCTFQADLLRWTTILMSEMLYMTISFGIIALCLDLDLDAVRRKDCWHIVRLAGICLLVVCAYFVRTMGISVILAVTLAFLVLAVKGLARRKTEGRRWLMPLLAAGLVLASFFIAKGCWDHRNQRVSPGYQSDYRAFFTPPAEDDGNPVSAKDFWVSRIANNSIFFIGYYIPYSVLNPEKSLLSPTSASKDDLSWVLGILVIALIVVGFLSMEGLQWLLLGYVLITFGVLVLYPTGYTNTRYFVPLIPLMTAAFVVGAGQVVGWLVRKLFHRDLSWLSPLVAMLLLLPLLPVYYQSQALYRKTAGIKSYAAVPQMAPFQAYIDACEACRNFPQDRLTAVLKPELFYVHSGFHHSVAIPRDGTPEEALSFLENNKVDVVIVDTWFPSAYRIILPAVERYPERFSLLGSTGDRAKPTLILGFR